MGGETDLPPNESPFSGLFGYTLLIGFFKGVSTNVYLSAYMIAVLNYNIASTSYVLYAIEQDQIINTVRYAAECASLPVGLLVGQLFFGIFTEVIGRRNVLQFCCFLLMLSSLLSIFAGLYIPGINLSSAGNIYANQLALELSIFRFLLGIAAGGLYPLIATVSKIGHQKSIVSSDIALIFGPVGGLGFILAPLVALMLTSMSLSNDLCWRMIIMIGTFPTMYLFWSSTNFASCFSSESHSYGSEFEKQLDKRLGLDKQRGRDITGTAIDTRISRQNILLLMRNRQGLSLTDAEASDQYESGDNSGDENSYLISSPQRSHSSNNLRDRNRGANNDNYYQQRNAAIIADYRDGEENDNSNTRLSGTGTSSRDVEEEEKDVMVNRSPSFWWHLLVAFAHNFSGDITMLLSYPLRILFLSAAASWFLSDLILYCNFVLLAKIIAMVISGNTDIYSLYTGTTNDDTTSTNSSTDFSIVLLSLVGTIYAIMFWFGGWFTVLALRKLSAIALQCQGFAILIGLFTLMVLFKLTLPDVSISTETFYIDAGWYILNLVLYAFTFGILGYSVAPTSFLMPSFLFPRHLRAAANGVAAAAGKTGAILGLLFIVILDISVVSILTGFVIASVLGLGVSMILLQEYIIVRNEIKQLRLLTAQMPDRGAGASVTNSDDINAHLSSYLDYISYNDATDTISVGHVSAADSVRSFNSKDSTNVDVDVDVSMDHEVIQEHDALLNIP